MGLYRTKPEEVEAIQYTGSMTQPFDGVVPAWVWGGISTGTLRFTGMGVEISYNGLTELAVSGDWLVLHNDGIIRACEDKVFKQYYTPARKRLAKGEAEDTNATSGGAAE
jgi:hypothetical protein